MDFSYLQTQFHCPNFNQENKAGFKIIELEEGRVINDRQVQETTIVFIIEGEASLSYSDNNEKQISKGQFLLLPSGVLLTLKVLKRIKIIRCEFDIQTMLCDYFRLDMLDSPDDASCGSFNPLEFNDCVVAYLDLIERYLMKGFLCSCLFKCKQQELFHLMRAFYSQKELSAFFSPILSRDMVFMNSVLKHYTTAQNVADLAEKMHYSLSGFRKKFEKAFGQSAFVWMQHKRSDLILGDLMNGKMSNKEIADKYDFSSDARFYEFCKRLYGKTPGQIRKHDDAVTLNP